ncbi:MAG: hypothetical protein V7K38_00320 [Nostoc sp.]|uniref:hypothetical protein n=1 Tax=Nostoc sp. TaxID=1180 RepID=UPI002FF793BA
MRYAVANTPYISVQKSNSSPIVPFEVCQELLAGGVSGFAVAEFEAATWLQKWQTPLNISPLLLNSLDLGEASVIQLPLTQLKTKQR